MNQNIENTNKDSADESFDPTKDLKKSTIEKKVVEIIEKHVKNEHKDKIALSAELGKDLNMDSLCQMELLMELDEVMKTDTDQEVAQTLTTVQSIIDYAWQGIQKRAQSGGA